MTDEVGGEVAVIERARREQGALTTAMLISDPAAFERLMQMAELMASGRSTVPRHLQGNKGDCAAIIQQAARWGMDANAVAQKTHLINGVLGYEAQLVIAVLNESGVLSGRMNWEWFGPWERITGKFKTVESKSRKDDDGNFKKFIVPDWNPADEQGLGVKAIATLRGEPNPRELQILMVQARTRNSTLWTEDPRQQLAYLAAKRWGRLHAPEVMLGVYTPDELEEARDQPKNMGNVEEVRPAPLDQADYENWKASALKGVASLKDFWEQAGKPFRKRTSQSQRDEMKAIADKADRERTIDDTPTAETATPAAVPTDGDTADFVAEIERAEKNAYQRAKDGD